ncbi:hypothetical protein M8J77_014572 [Diaphorina citri]|nr:hypothetical protein M8J77_014572 [Diaphorina citri]
MGRPRPKKRRRLKHQKYMGTPTRRTAAERKTEEQMEGPSQKGHDHPQSHNRGLFQPGSMEAKSWRGQIPTRVCVAMDVSVSAMIIIRKQSHRAIAPWRYKVG